MSITVNVLQNGLTSYRYRFRYRCRTYRGHLGHNLTLAEARRLEAVARGQAAAGTHPPPARQRRHPETATPLATPTALAFAQRFLDAYAVDARPRSVQTRTDHLNHHLLPYLGSYRLDALSTAVVDAYRTARRQEGASAHTLNGELATLSLMLHTAADWGELPKSALPVVRWLRVEEKPVRVLSAEEETRLLMAATPHLRPLLRFALHTGLRKRELLTLTWDAIDRARREVTVVGFIAKNRHQRTIPLNREALRALEEAHRRHGRVFGYRTTASVMDRATKLAHLPGVNLHTLRRSFATRLLHAGVDVDTVRRLLGHRSLAVTQRYLGHNPDVARQAVERLEVEHRRSSFIS